jgi:hypothetical protein
LDEKAFAVVRRRPEVISMELMVLERKMKQNGGQVIQNVTLEGRKRKES